MTTSQGVSLLVLVGIGVCLWIGSGRLARATVELVRSLTTLRPEREASLQRFYAKGWKVVAGTIVALSCAAFLVAVGT